MICLLPLLPIYVSPLKPRSIFLLFPIRCHRGGKKAKNTKIRLTGSSQNKFELAVYQLKKEWKILDVSHRLKGGNPLWPFFLLLVGIFGISLSITWLIHIGIFMTPDIPFTPFLNNFFVTMQDAIEGFPLFGIVTFCIYCLWLLWCCVKGAFRFGLRIPFCFKVCADYSEILMRVSHRHQPMTCHL